MTSDTKFQLEFNIDVYKQFIIKHVKVSHLLPDIVCMRGHAARLHKLDRDGKYAEAGELFLSVLKQADDDAKWQQFRDALHQEGYEHVIKLLDGDIGSENHEEKIKIIELLQQKVARHIDPRELCDHLKGKNVFSDIDEQEIHQLASNHGDIAASIYLLNNIWKKKINWYEEFLNVLIDLGRVQVARLINPDFVEKRQAKKKKEEPTMDTAEAESEGTDVLQTHNNFQRNTENTGQDGSKHSERHRLAKISRQVSGDSQPSSIVLPSWKQSTHTQNTPKSSTSQTLAMTRHGAELKSKPPHVNKKRPFALSSISSEDETDLISFTDDGHADNETSTVPANTGPTAYTANCDCCAKIQEEMRSLKCDMEEIKKLLSKLVLEKS